MLGYKADILCLQEVDRSFFNGLLKDAMLQNSVSYEGYLRLKPQDVGEGCAIFFRKDKYRYVMSHDIEDMVEELHSNKLFEDLFDKISKVETVYMKLKERKFCLQLILLQDCNDDSKYILVATTHLYFHPNFENIRLIQMIMWLRYIESILTQYKDKGIEPALIFSGDFNSCPTRGIYQLATTGHISSRHPDWYCGGKPNLIDDMELNHSLQLFSACGKREFTNYTAGYIGCLDYIFADKIRFDVKQLIPSPDVCDIQQYIACPSEVIPSDHIAQVCDLQWKSIV